MIGVDIRLPNTPPLDIVKVPPFMSSIVSVPSLAFLPYPAIALSISAKLFLSQSRTTGTTRPFGADTATEMST